MEPLESFFSAAQPTRQVTHGCATFDLPVLYHRDDAFGLFYTADLDKVSQLMPSPSLHPVRLPGNRSAAGVFAFNYIDTSIGPYGEVAIVVPVVHGKKPPTTLIPLLLESKYPGFGLLVLHLPVTHPEARDAGRGQWGYTKFTADMRFTITPEFMECQLQEGDHHILSLRVARQGLAMRDKKPLVTYSVLNRDLIKTTIPQTGAHRLAIGPKKSYLELGSHPVANTLHSLEMAPNPLLSRYYLERGAILPAGTVVESGVMPLEGYHGDDQERAHTVAYTE